MRTSILAITLIVSACAQMPEKLEATNNYYIVKEVAGCITYKPKHNEPADKSIIPMVSFEQTALQLLTLESNKNNALSKSLHDNGKSQACWYETPLKDVRLTIGDYCEATTDIIYRYNDNKWSIVETHDYIAFCDRMAK